MENSLYQHFKGHYYKTHKIAKSADTLEEYIVYESETGQFWIRKLSEFNEMVQDGAVPRFKFIEKLD